MKKLLLFALAALTLAPHAHAQTAQETMDWLNAKLPPVVNAQFYRPVTERTLLDIGAVEQHSGQVRAHIKLIYFTMTSISLISCDQDGEHHPFCLSFSGTVLGCVDGQEDCTKSSTYTLSLETQDSAAATSLLNAFKHMAQLNNAPLVKDNLF